MCHTIMQGIKLLAEFGNDSLNRTYLIQNWKIIIYLHFRLEYVSFITELNLRFSQVLTSIKLQDVAKMMHSEKKHLDLLCINQISCKRYQNTCVMSPIWFKRQQKRYEKYDTLEQTVL